MSRSKERSPSDSARREQAFALYRDMGPSRTYRGLQEAIRSTHGSLTPKTLQRWAKEHQWKSRCAEQDRQRLAASDTILTPDFDKVEQLYLAAHLALTRALNSMPTVTTPQEFKALIDAARIAIQLGQKIEEIQGKARAADPAETRAHMWALIDEIEERVRLSPRVPRGLVVDEDGRAQLPGVE